MKQAKQKLKWMDASDVGHAAKGDIRHQHRIALIQYGASANLRQLETTLAGQNVMVANANLIRRCGFRDDAWAEAVGKRVQQAIDADTAMTELAGKLSDRELETSLAYVRWEKISVQKSYGHNIEETCKSIGECAADNTSFVHRLDDVVAGQLRVEDFYGSERKM